MTVTGLAAPKPDYAGERCAECAKPYTETQWAERCSREPGSTEEVHEHCCAQCHPQPKSETQINHQKQPEGIPA